MFVVGLTGGIGSGKSTVAKIFQDLGVPIYSADDAARKIVDNDAGVQSEIRTEFGDEYFNGNVLDRKKMAGLVFRDKAALEKLNHIIHPAVGRDFRQWLSEQSAPYIIREAAILFESGTYRDCDQIILVTADRESRIKRVMRRDQVSREDVMKRMENQWPDDKKIPLSDYQIENKEVEDVIYRVNVIHNEILKKANLQP